MEYSIKNLRQGAEDSLKYISACEKRLRCPFTMHRSWHVLIREIYHSLEEIGKLPRFQAGEYLGRIIKEEDYSIRTKQNACVVLLKICPLIEQMDLLLRFLKSWKKLDLEPYLVKIVSNLDYCFNSRIKLAYLLNWSRNINATMDILVNNKIEDNIRRVVLGYCGRALCPEILVRIAEKDRDFPMRLLALDFIKPHHQKAWNKYLIEEMALGLLMPPKEQECQWLEGEVLSARQVAIAKLDPQDERHRYILQKIAHDDKNTRIRLAAIAKLHSL